VKNYARGTAAVSLEDVLFSMDEGSLSNLIETSEGYYIVKCISTMDYEATQENKLVLAEQRKKEAFSKAYAEVAQNTHSQFRDKQWEKLTLSEEIHGTEANFFEIYETYIKQ
jgi:foldase protein PrsA